MKKICIALAMLVALAGNAHSQSILKKPVPVNKDVRIGKLENGLSYYLIHNETPKNCASFYIVQNVGAMMENDNQNGLAHFLEHMAFNGTEHFPGKGIINTLEKHGVQFGKDINAYTAKNETVYNLSNVPTNKKGLVDTCLLVLHDWANGLSLKTEEIDAERGVISEEWRTRRNAQLRIMNKMAPALLNHSKYGKRDVIGDLDIIQNFKPETIKEFYHDWYRSDLQCIIVSGDIDVKKVEKKVKALFSKIPAVENAKQRQFYEIKDNKETAYCLATDKEVQHTNISLYIRHRATDKEDITHQNLRDNYITSMLNMMMGERIADIMRSEETPFLNASISYQSLVRGYKAYFLSVVAKAGKDKEAFKRLLDINQLALNEGFKANEFLMAKTKLMMDMESFYKQRKSMNNEAFASQCKDHYLFNSPMPGVEYLYNFFKKQINTITADDVHQKLKELYKKENRTLVVIGAEREDAFYPTKEELLQLMDADASEELISNSNEEEVTEFFDADLKGGAVEKVEKLKRLMAEKWTLSNGAKVVYKYCNQHPEVISLYATSLGGSSVLADEDMPSSTSIGAVIGTYGIGKHSVSNMKKLLTGKQVGVALILKELTENLSADCKKVDFETMLQMVYMAFEQPRFDKKAHDLEISRSLASMRGIKKTYDQILNDSVNMIINSYHPRVRIHNEEYVNDISLEKIEEIYRDRYQDASDFTFYIVGDISKKKAKELAAKYIGSISSTNRKESWKDSGSFFPKGKTEKVFEFEMATPSAGAVIVYQKPFEYSYKNLYAFNLLSESLKLRFTEEIREKEGGTYGVNVGGNVRRIPEGLFTINMQFQCDPARVKELKQKLYDEINKVVENGIPESDYKKIMSAMRQMNSQKIKHNKYWLDVLKKYDMYQEDHTSKKYFEDVINDLSLEYVHNFAKQFFQNADLVDIIYLPKK
jgi:zinc protease